MEPLELAKHILTIIKEAYQADSAAIYSLLWNTVSCNCKYTSTIKQHVMSNNKGYLITNLGIVNGILTHLTGGVHKIGIEYVKSDNGYQNIIDFYIGQEKQSSDFISKENYIEGILDILNTLFKVDPQAIHMLVCNRVSCNQALIEHPLIQVTKNYVLSDDFATLDLLGLINGIFNIITNQKIGIQFSDLLYERKYRKIVGFYAYV